MGTTALDQFEQDIQPLGWRQLAIVEASRFLGFIVIRELPDNALHNKSLPQLIPTAHRQLP